MNRGKTRDWWVRLGVLGVVLLGSLGYLVARAFGGAELVNISVTPGGRAITFHDVRLWLLAALLAAVVVLLNWGLAEHRRAGLRDTLRRERRANRSDDEARMGRRLAEGEVAELRDELGAERDRHADLQAAWRSEHEWGRELRRQLDGIGRGGRPPEGFDEVAATVLGLTLMLVEAGKGLVVAGGRVAAATGFDQDPGDSALAERFAGGGLTPAAPTRWDDASPLGARTRADAEVQNLLAIPVGPIDGVPAVIVCANRDGGFQGLDEDVLRAVADRAGAVLAAARLSGERRSRGG